MLDEESASGIVAKSL